MKLAMLQTYLTLLWTLSSLIQGHGYRLRLVPYNPGYQIQPIKYNNFNRNGDYSTFKESYRVTPGRNYDTSNFGQIRRISPSINKNYDNWDRGENVKRASKIDAESGWYTATEPPYRLPQDNYQYQHQPKRNNFLPWNSYQNYPDYTDTVNRVRRKLSDYDIEDEVKNHNEYEEDPPVSNQIGYDRADNDVSTEYDDLPEKGSDNESSEKAPSYPKFDTPDRLDPPKDQGSLPVHNDQSYNDVSTEYDDNLPEKGSDESSEKASSYPGFDTPDRLDPPKDQGSYFVHNEQSFVDEVLEAHNMYRTLHRVSPVIIDEDLNKMAQSTAEKIATGKFLHSEAALSGTVGENLAVYSNSVSGGKIVDLWYRESEDFDWQDPKMVFYPEKGNNDHFTAMVWSEVQKIGVGKAKANDGRIFVAVNYFPPPNWPDEVKENVFPPKTVNFLKGAKSNMPNYY